MKKEIFALIEEVLGVPEGTITEESRAEDIEAWDSLAQVMIIGALEEKFGIVISLDEAAEIESVAELLEKAGVL